MSKLYNQIVPLSIIPKFINVSSLKKILKKDQTSNIRVNVTQNVTSVDENYNMFKSTINAVADKIKLIFSTILKWLEKVKQALNSESIEKDTTYLKVWTFLIKMEDRKSTNQFKIILDQFTTDIKVNF
jgi:hypothetical protein